MTPQEVMALEKKAGNSDGEWEMEDHQKSLRYSIVQGNGKKAFIRYTFTNQLKKQPFTQYMMEHTEAMEKLEAAGDDKESEAAQEAMAILDSSLEAYDQLPDTRAFDDYRLNCATISWLDLDEDGSNQLLLDLEEEFGKPLDEPEDYIWDNARSEITYNRKDYIIHKAKYKLQEEWISRSPSPSASLPND
jgi:Mg2+ and Co2+ transporter CorA